MILKLTLSTVVFVSHWLAAGAAYGIDVGPPLKTLRAVGTHGKGHREATAAWKVLSQAEVSQLPEILAGMQGADALAQNWIRAVAETIAERQIKSGGKLPVAGLEHFLSDTRQAPRARRLAYE